MSDPFDEAALLRAASAQVPDADFGGEEFRPALTQLLAALRDEADLEPRGIWVALARLVASLVRRRRLAALRARAPELDAQPIPAPIFILGFPRTGTTLLHNLLAADPSKRAIRLWEMREPFAPADAGPDYVAETIAATAKIVDAAYQLTPRLRDIHPLRPTWPDECSWLFRNSLSSMVLGFSYYVPSYVRWLLSHDMGPAYAYFATQLRALTFQRPGAPLVLKDPCHIWHLDALLDTFPDARIIHLHRDVSEVLPSFCSLVNALHAGGSRVRPPAQIGAYVSEMLEAGMTRMLEVRGRLDAAARDGSKPAAPILDLHYRRLVDDPLGTVAAIHEHFGLEQGPEAQAAMTTWLAENRGLSGRHRYSLASYGLEPEAVAEGFAPYTARFELSPSGRTYSASRGQGREARA